MVEISSNEAGGGVTCFVVVEDAWLADAAKEIKSRISSLLSII